MGQAGDDLRERHPGKLRRSYFIARFDEHLNPHAEALRIKVLVESRTCGSPQIEIEDVGQLCGRGLGDELGAVFETDGIDDAMQQLRPQLRRKRREAMNEFVWQADESIESAPAQTDCF
jgi:hypothetical protein